MLETNIDVDSAVVPNIFEYMTWKQKQIDEDGDHLSVSTSFFGPMTNSILQKQKLHIKEQV